MAKPDSTHESNYERIPSTAPPHSESDQIIAGLENDESPVSSSSSSISHASPAVKARRTLINFIAMAVLFSANHGCTVACLSLATSRLGSIGAWQSGTLYITYTASALMGATYVSKRYGGRNAMTLGMSLYCIYVACFWYAATLSSRQQISTTVPVLLGAAIGGVGGGFLWTAQGTYFAQASAEHASWLQRPVQDSTAHLAGIFAFVYLAEEVLLKLLSTVLLKTTQLSWKTIFGVYTLVAVVSTGGMGGIRNYPPSRPALPDDGPSIWYKVTAAGQLLWKDPKMIHMVGLNAVFGFAGAFVNSYVNAQVVRIALEDETNQYVGGLTAWLALVAAVMSLVLARVAQRYGKGSVLILGALCFLGVALPFVLQPNIEQQWGWGNLILIYTLQGTGRATFESTLKATFADFFSYEKEGAFANIILQNGLSSAIGYVLTFRLLCHTPSNYCVEYKDGSLHNVLAFELLVIGMAILAIVGYIWASTLFQQEQDELERSEPELLENQEGVTA